MTIDRNREGEHAYLQRREADERAAAAHADGDEAHAAHRDLARGYAARAHETEGEPARSIEMQVRDCMTREVRLIDPDETIEEAAVLMATIDAGVLPVALDDRLVGMVTDRDIAIRGVGMSLQPNAKVRAVMSSEVLYCFEDDDIGDVLANMADMQIRRLPVVDRDKRLVGILSLSDVAGNGDMARAGKVLCEIARPSALHSQAV